MKNGMTIMTLDAGGTNFVFSAFSGMQEITEPVHRKAAGDNLEKCLETIREGFMEISSRTGHKASAISFAFPGPADYENGIIGNLPNFPAFRGGVALGPYLEEVFSLPVFINNDGNLFAYGEALCGALPWVNARLQANGVRRRYRNLIGITLGTGFGAGVVTDGILLRGDNGCGGDTWLMDNCLYPGMPAEESVSIRAVKRVYSEICGEDHCDMTPEEIYEIAKGMRKGNRDAAIESFRQLGTAAGDAITNAVNIADGLVVIGGGISGAAEFILPSLIGRMRGSLRTFSGESFPRLQTQVWNLDREDEMATFIQDRETSVNVPGSGRKVPYLNVKKTGVMTSRLGTSRAIALGACEFAVRQLENKGYDCE